MTGQIITIDCETLPTEVPFDAGAFWKTEDEYRRTALDGNFGRLLCIGYTREAAGKKLAYGCFGWDAAAERFTGDERLLLAGFWEMMRGFVCSRDTVVGHNILDFDLPFIIKRSIINGVRPTVAFSFARYQRQPVFDTMREWDCWSAKNATSLDKLAFVLGLPSPKKEGLSGANLYEAYLSGRHREIYEYCMRDVKTARNAFRRMSFTFPAENARAPALSA